MAALYMIAVITVCWHNRWVSDLSPAATIPMGVRRCQAAKTGMAQYAAAMLLLSLS